MFKNKLAIGIAILALVVSGVAINSSVNSESFSGGTQSWTKHSFIGGLWAGDSRQVNISRSGVLTSQADLNIDSGDLFVDVSANKLGIGSTTPTTDLSIGTANATSTTSGGNFCAFFQDEAGTGVWITIALNSSNVFATSTTACN